jgi:hypothetical protein
MFKKLKTYHVIYLFSPSHFELKRTYGLAEIHIYFIDALWYLRFICFQSVFLWDFCENNYCVGFVKKVKW